MKEKVIKIVKKHIEKCEFMIKESLNELTEIVDVNQIDKLSDDKLKIYNTKSSLVQYNTAAWFELKSLLTEIENLDE
jgi:hypothetical protein